MGCATSLTQANEATYFSRRAHKPQIQIDMWTETQRMESVFMKIQDNPTTFFVKGQVKECFKRNQDSYSPSQQRQSNGASSSLQSTDDPEIERRCLDLHYQ